MRRDRCLADDERGLAGWRAQERSADAIVVRALDSGSAAVRDLVVSLAFHDAVAAHIANEFLYAPTRLSFDIVPTVTGPADST